MTQEQKSRNKVLEKIVTKSLDSYLDRQSIEIQQELNQRRMKALANKKQQAFKSLMAIAFAASFVWFGTNISNKNGIETSFEDVIIVDVEIEEAPTVELEVLEHTDFLLWLSEQEDEAPHS